MNGGACLLRRCACDAHFRLNHMNSLYNIGIGRKVIFYAAELFRIRKQALHFLLRAAIAELEVIEHGIVLLGKALICVLYGFHCSTHLIGVIRHIRNGKVCRRSRLFRIPIQTLQQACRKARNGFHIFICGQTRSFIRIIRISLNRVCAVLEQRFHAADQLFIVRIGIDARSPQSRNPCRCRADCRSTRLYSRIYRTADFPQHPLKWAVIALNFNYNRAVFCQWFHLFPYGTSSATQALLDVFLVYLDFKCSFAPSPLAA